MSCSQSKRRQIEQRLSLYQYPLRLVTCPVSTVTPFPCVISFAHYSPDTLPPFMRQSGNCCYVCATYRSHPISILYHRLCDLSVILRRKFENDRKLPPSVRTAHLLMNTPTHAMEFLGRCEDTSLCWLSLKSVNGSQRESFPGHPQEVALLYATPFQAARAVRVE